LVNHVEWDLGPNVSYDSTAFRDELDASVSTPQSPRRLRNKGDIDAAFAQAAKTIDAHYYVPHLAQTPMEPPVATARFDGDHLEVWTPTQNPDAAQQMAGVVAFDIPFEKWELETTKEEMRKKVTLHMPLIGGGF